MYISWTPNPGVMWQTPAGPPTSQKWEARLKLDMFTIGEVLEVERVSGMPWCVLCIADQLRFNNYRLARPAIVWVLMLRKNPGVTFDFVLNGGVVDVTFSRGELLSWRRQMEGTLLPGELAALDQEIAGARR